MGVSGRAKESESEGGPPRAKLAARSRVCGVAAEPLGGAVDPKPFYPNPFLDYT